MGYGFQFRQICLKFKTEYTIPATVMNRILVLDFVILLRINI